MIKASCHCGATKLKLASVPTYLLRCNCSFCSKRGSVWAYYAPQDVTMEALPQPSPTYRFGRKAIRHHFCPTCGCSTFAELTSWETGEPQISVNALLFDDFDITTIAVADVDGKSQW